MCRNIRTLHNFEPPATRDEVHAAAVQYVRKISGFRKPARFLLADGALALWDGVDGDALQNGGYTLATLQQALMQCMVVVDNEPVIVDNEFVYAPL